MFSSNWSPIMYSRFIFFMVVSFIIDMSPSQADYLRELSHRNTQYINKINNNEEQRRGGALLNFNELNEMNQDRFAYAAGVDGVFRREGPTEKEWFAISNSVWQHAALLLERPDFYLEEKQTFGGGFKSEIGALLRKVTKGNNINTINPILKSNTLILMEGLFYAIQCYTGKNLDGWVVADLSAYREEQILRASNKLKRHMDLYFGKVYNSLKKKNTSSEIEGRNYGHLVFAVGNSQAQAHFTLVTKIYVTIGQYERVHDRLAPLYVAKVASTEQLKEHYRVPEKLKGLFVSPDYIDFNKVPSLKPLIFSSQNTKDFPKDDEEPIQIRLKHLKRLEDFNIEIYEEGKIRASSAKFTIKGEEPKSKVFSSKPGNYIYSILDFYMVYPNGLYAEWCHKSIRGITLGFSTIK